MFVVIALCVATIGQSQEVDKNIFKKPWIVILPGFEQFMQKVPQSFIADSIELQKRAIDEGGVTPKEIKPFFGAGNFMSILAGNFSYQMFNRTCSGVSLSDLKVNYFLVSDSTAGSYVVKIYKRIDLADGKWYIDAMPVESMFVIVDGYILEPK